MKTSLHFEGTIKSSEIKTYKKITFRVPANTKSLNIKFQFTPYSISLPKEMITLTLFDTTGFRGAGHRGGNNHEVFLGETFATPGYLPGPIKEGEWTVELDTHMILPGETCNYNLDINFNPKNHGENYPTDKSLKEQKQIDIYLKELHPVEKPDGWLVGDLHTHTNHSDGQWTTEDLLRTVTTLKLDFLGITDHNTVSALPEAHKKANTTILIIDGMELTTYWGHALCLGTSKWIDWRTFLKPSKNDYHSMEEIARKALTSNLLFIISHPGAIGDPFCTGCKWKYPRVSPGPVRLVEVWNGPWKGLSNNEESLRIWYKWLNRGIKIFATAGSDIHRIEYYLKNSAFTYVKADKPDIQEIFHSIKSGHSFISSGPTVYIEGISPGGEKIRMGGELKEEKGAAISIIWDKSPPGATIRLIGNADSIYEKKIGSKGNIVWDITKDHSLWYVAEMRSITGEMLSLTNPVFIKRY